MSGGMRAGSESGQGVPPGFRQEFGGWPGEARRVALCAWGPQAPFQGENWVLGCRITALDGKANKIIHRFHQTDIKVIYFDEITEGNIMQFTALVGDAAFNIRSTASTFLSRLDHLQEMYNQVSRDHPSTNHLELLALKVLRRHTADIVEGRTTQPIHAEELLLAQQEMSDIKQFMSSNQIMGMLTGSSSFSALTESLRKVSIEYAAMVDALIDDRRLFSSYQPSPQRTIG